MWRCDNVGGLGERVKKHVLWFLRIKIFFALYFCSRRARTREPISTIYASYDVFPPNDLSFGVSFILLPILRVKSPKTLILGAWISISSLTCKILKFAYNRNYCVDYNQILHSYKDHQILFVGGPNTRKTNPRWRTAAILKIENRPSPERFYRSPWNLVRRRILGLRRGPVVKISNF